MRLTLKVRTYCDQPPIDVQHRQFDAFPVILGRSSACDYCLDDASRYISSNHALISIEGGQLVIQDTSANGVYLNGTAEPVGRGRSQPLRHGDTLAIGDYTLVATIETSFDAASLSPVDDPFADFASSPTRAVLPDTPEAYDPFRGDEPDWTPPSTRKDDPFTGDWDLNDSPGVTEEASAVSGDSDWADWPDERADRPSAARVSMTPGRNPAPVPTAHAPVPPHAELSPENSGSRASLASLYKAAGLRESDLNQLSDAEVLEQTGRLLIQMVDAMMALLQSRTELKNAIRSDITTLSKNGNNPLKFSFSAADALTKMLADKNAGYLPASEAIQEAVDDLKLHQVAMLEGMKSALKSVLLQFDPQRLAKKLEKTGGITANIPITREAKLWELFCEHYDTIHEEAISDFAEMYGAEFRKAYEMRIRKKGRTPDF